MSLISSCVTGWGAVGLIAVIWLVLSVVAGVIIGRCMDDGEDD